MNVYANFHDLAGIDVETESVAAAHFFASEYALHTTDALPIRTPRIYLHFRETRWPFPPQGYTFHAHKWLARWAYKVRFEEDSISFDVLGNRFAIPMVHHMMVHPALRYLAAQQGVLMLHAGAVTRGERSFIFTGHGGAGKTTTTSLVLAVGGDAWGIHADDYVFLAEGPRTLAYLTRAHLYRSLLQWIPSVRNVLSPKERLQLEIFGRVRAWSGERIKWPVRADLRRLWPGRSIHMQGQPAGLFVLERSDIPMPRVAPREVDDTLVDELIHMNFGEARHFLTLMEKSSVPLDVADWRAMERDALVSRLREIPVFRLTLPLHTESFSKGRQQVFAIVDALENTQL